MYGYYMLKALRLPCPIPDFFITTMQISQMIVGTFIQVRAAGDVHAAVLSPRAREMRGSSLLIF